MKRYLIYGLGALSLVVGLSVNAQSKSKQTYKRNLAQRVNPMIGTDWVGNTYPGANAPFGMVQLSPDNGLPGWDRIAGYFYPDSTIAGFSHTHLSGTGAGDMYDISFLPVIEPALRAEAPLGLHAKFTHDSERASAGRYSVVLQPYNIEVELTATQRIGIQRYTFRSASDSAVIHLNLSKAMNWDRTQESSIRFGEGDQAISGHRYSDGWARNQRVYFYSRLSRKPESIELDSVALYHPDTKKQEGWGYTAKMYYKVRAGERITIETALSGTSQEDAKRNYLAERQPSFAAYLAHTQRDWEKHLGLIRISEKTSDRVSHIFYTALYHAMLCPTLYSNADGTYLGADRQIRRSSGKHYSTFSLWDTYRTAHPLYNIILPQENKDMVQSLVDFGIQNKGHFPVWNMWASETDMMIGHHSLPVIAAAIEAGIYQVQDRAKLAEAVRTTLNRKGYRAMDIYRDKGYVPSDKHQESLSLTLEYAYNDWAGARILKALGYAEEAKRYLEHSKNYRHLWDDKSGFFRPRLSSGEFKPDFDPFAYTEDVTESNAYQYLWSAQHDPEGLRTLMGGKQGLAKRLDDFFTSPTPQHVQLPIFSTGMIGQYAHGNEPGHHSPFLYYWADQPWRTTELVHEVLHKLYTDAPDGLCGNEDCGQMSAWYVMSAIGLYPVEAANEYLITSPIIESAQLGARGAKPFHIRAKGLSAERKYIKSVRLNGKPYPYKSLSLAQIQAGGVLELEMTNERGLCWYK